MALTPREQVGWWGAGLIAFLGLMYFLGGALAPYLLGMGMAYCLDPVADRLERWGLSRLMATLTIMFVAFLVFLFAVLLAIPFVAEQVSLLIAAAPGIFDGVREFVNTRFPGLMAEGSALREGLASAQGKLQEWGLALTKSVLSGSLALLDIVLLVVIAPVVAAYLLYDWDNMVAKIDGWLPLDHKETIRDLARQVDATLASFMRGQLAVMAFLGTFYAVGLTLIGLDFSGAVGLFAGLISFIPFVGTILGGGLALAIAVFQFWGDWVWIGAVLGVFVAGQFIEGNFLTPNLVGSSVGLHPVVLMFALSAFGALFGFVGLLIAVPVAASLGVLARFSLGQYLQSRLYMGLAGRAPEDDESA